MSQPSIHCTLVYTINRWLAELGPMFFTIKEQSFSTREKKVLDKLENQNMEEELQRAREERAKKETRPQTEVVASKSKIVTPGFKRPLTGKREIGTPRTKARLGI